ncbi:MAG: EamA family transporter [Steroidobacterales bacterium]
MNPRTRPSPDAVLLPVAVLILAMAGFQTGAALAKTLIPVVGASGAVALRLTYATLMLWLVWRPWRMRVDAKGARTIVVYGIALGCMNLLFYLALQRIPLGIAVALEFTGPLAVAVAAAIRPLDFLWVGLAVLGVLMVLPLGGASQALDLAGIFFALGGGVCWALYIVYGRRAGIRSGGQTTAMGMLIGAICIVPFGVAHAGMLLLKPEILPTALAVAFLSSAMPYSLEMYAMTRLPARSFGVLMSMDPALAAASGLVLLGERLTWVQWAAIGCIVLASAGSAATHQSEAA